MEFNNNKKGKAMYCIYWVGTFILSALFIRQVIVRVHSPGLVVDSPTPSLLFNIPLTNVILHKFYTLSFSQISIIRLFWEFYGNLAWWDLPDYKLKIKLFRIKHTVSWIILLIHLHHLLFVSYIGWNSLPLFIIWTSIAWWFIKQVSTPNDHEKNVRFQKMLDIKWI